MAFLRNLRLLLLLSYIGYVCLVELLQLQFAVFAPGAMSISLRLFLACIWLTLLALAIQNASEQCLFKLVFRAKVSERLVKFVHVKPILVLESKRVYLDCTSHFAWEVASLLRE